MRALSFVLLAAMLLAVALAISPVDMSVPQLIEHAGYTCEIHNVTTADGYILEVHRIPYGRAGPGNGTRPVVLLQHGFLDSSFTWVANLPNESLGFIMADAGYDVWLGNSRGNTYGRRHVDLSPDDPAFWAFSWDQMASFDLPAKIEYALATNGAADTLVYVGHSEGTQIGFAAFSSNATLAAMVDPFVAFSPIVYLGNISTPGLAQGADELPDWFLYDVFGHNASLFADGYLDFINSDICAFFETACEEFICEAAGCDSDSSLNSSRLEIIMNHFPAGSSSQNLVHYAQSVRTDKFIHYNYDSAGVNLQHYGVPTPPEYNIHTLHPRTFICTGGADKFADKTDVERLLKNMPPPAWLLTIPDFGHGDFVWSLLAAKQVYEPLLQQLASTSPLVN